MALNKRFSILLVEDNLDHAELIMEALQTGTLTTQIEVVHDGEEALDYFYHRGQYLSLDPPNLDFVLLDIKLPRMDGFEVLREVKNDARLKIIPIILLTTSSTEAEIEKGYELGANSFVVKPLNFKVFTEKVRDIQKYWEWTNTLPATPY
jgi:two-component system, response regulator